MTNKIKYHQVKANDTNIIELIASWYLSEWNIPIETTKQKLSSFPEEGMPFQVIMTVNETPVATGGIYHHVSLLDREPKYKIYQHWLALIYTTPQNRNKGYAALLCKYLEQQAQLLDLKTIYLYTHTAESLYQKLNWQVLERIEIENKKIVVMKLDV